MTFKGDEVDRLKVFYEVARENGSLISLQEALSLMPEGTTAEELSALINGPSSPELGHHPGAGYVVLERGEAVPGVAGETLSRRRAAANLEYARRIFPFMASRKMSVIAVSGSTSYGSAAKSVDLDLFCITRTEMLWPALTKSLIIARTFRLLNRGAPPVCLSCIMDESFAAAMFGSARDPLFARDALSAVVLHGEERYSQVLKEANWISAYYPRLYASRAVSQESKTGDDDGPDVWDRIINKLLFQTVGRFLTLKSGIANRRLRSRGNTESLFKLEAGEDHYMYESARYSKLRQSYARLPSASSVPRETSGPKRDR